MPKVILAEGPFLHCRASRRLISVLCLRSPVQTETRCRASLSHSIPSNVPSLRSPLPLSTLFLPHGPSRCLLSLRLPLHILQFLTSLLQLPHLHSRSFRRPSNTEIRLSILISRSQLHSLHIRDFASSLLCLLSYRSLCFSDSSNFEPFTLGKFHPSHRSQFPLSPHQAQSPSSRRVPRHW